MASLRAAIAKIQKMPLLAKRGRLRLRVDWSALYHGAINCADDDFISCASIALVTGNFSAFAQQLLFDPVAGVLAQFWRAIGQQARAAFDVTFYFEASSNRSWTLGRGAVFSWL